MSAALPGITVVIPTFRRVAELDRCLAAIDGQLLKPVEVLITYRHEDQETRDYLARGDRPGLGARLILCDKPGVVYALTMAMNAVRSEFFAITDDDSVAPQDWLERIMAHFEANPLVAGVGGKDHVCAGGEWFEGAEPVVGKVTWYGGLIGHHHLGVGPARYVETLKGVNLAFRRSAIGDLRPDPRLRGRGAQVGWEMHLTLTLIARGHKLIYDPEVLVDHFPGNRPMEEDRAKFNPVSHGDEVFNRTLIVLDFFATQRWGALRRLALFAYYGVRGTRKAPGLVLLAYGLLTGYPDIWARFKATFSAYRDAIVVSRKTSTQLQG
jgi:glycosyltransferase involved in cell wall biosynthesis